MSLHGLRRSRRAEVRAELERLKAWRSHADGVEAESLDTAIEVLVFALRSRPQPRVEGPSEAWKSWAAGACALLDEHFRQRPIQEEPQDDGSGSDAAGRGAEADGDLAEVVDFAKDAAAAVGFSQLDQAVQRPNFEAIPEPLHEEEEVEVDLPAEVDIDLDEAADVGFDCLEQPAVHDKFKAIPESPLEEAEVEVDPFAEVKVGLDPGTECFQFENLAADAGFNHLEQPAEQVAFEVMPEPLCEEAEKEEDLPEDEKLEHLHSEHVAADLGFKQMAQSSEQEAFEDRGEDGHSPAAERCAAQEIEKPKVPMQAFYAQLGARFRKREAPPETETERLEQSVPLLEESARNSASHMDLSAPPPPLIPDTTDRLTDDEDVGDLVDEARLEHECDDHPRRHGHNKMGSVPEPFPEPRDLTPLPEPPELCPEAAWAPSLWRDGEEDVPPSTGRNWRSRPKSSPPPSPPEKEPEPAKEEDDPVRSLAPEIAEERPLSQQIEELRLRRDTARSAGDFDKALDAAALLAALTPTAEARLRLAVARLESGGQDQQALEDLKQIRLLAESSGEPLGEDFARWFRMARHWAVQPARRNHYRALGIPADASSAEVKAAYRKALLLFHPDKAGGDAERFRAVQEAWELIGTETMRRVYNFGALSVPARPTTTRMSEGGAVEAPSQHIFTAGLGGAPTENVGAEQPQRSHGRTSHRSRQCSEATQRQHALREVGVPAFSDSSQSPQPSGAHT
ncbi:DNAJC30 [Symbiodinium sp. CCMP2592]|nr:DNAJC30 [Symbiodinium sp. CCMP2592]